MKIISHGDSIVFTCPKCHCVFSELLKVCYSSMGEDGAHYILSCPECSNICFETDEKQKERRAKKNDDQCKSNNPISSSL